jgi:hypothetical protein
MNRFPLTAACQAIAQRAPGPIGPVLEEDRPLPQIGFDAHDPGLDKDLPVLRGPVGMGASLDRILVKRGSRTSLCRGIYVRSAARRSE